MERKRKLPARAVRGEGDGKKKRTSTPPDPQKQTQTPAVPPPAMEESLPKSIAPGKPLPTVSEAQPEDLSSKYFQSIPESGVLPESLNRSRAKWISEGIFEKYWTKVTKKKGAPEQPKDNPPKDSMTKLGTCTITVEPHIFEATMYAIKDTTPRPPPPPPQNPMTRPIIQYGPPGGMMPPPPPTPLFVQTKAAPAPQPTPQPSPKIQDVHMKNSSPAPSYNLAAPAAPQSNGYIQNGTPVRPPPPHPTASNPPAVNPIPPSLPIGRTHQDPAVQQRTDPVIQMLAERAATDPDLKGLMRIVANGEATPEELRKFQAHIDELTRIQKARQDMEARPTPPPPAVAVQPPPPTPVKQENGYSTTLQTQQPQTPAPPPPAPTPVRVAPTPPAPTPTPIYQAPQPQALRSKGPVPATKPDISGVVFEFTGGNGDRYLFPKFSILEYPPNSSQVITSFLIIRKGSASDSPTYDPALDYYQPITIRLYATQGRQLEALQKVVAAPEEVRRYMDDVMDTATRAEYVLLAMRLPREVDQPAAPVGIEGGEAEKGDPMEDVQVNWATTNPPAPPPQPKPVKEIPTEQQQYSNFIQTVQAVPYA